MFVNRLNSRQQGLLLTLGKKLNAADGNIHDKETILMAALQAQMAPDIEAIVVSEVGEEFQSRDSKVALLLELLGIAHADEEYHLEEQGFIARLAQDFGIDKELLADMESWVLRQFALVREAEEFMEG